MCKRMTILILIIVFCMSGVILAKDTKVKKPPEVYFYWGDNALMTVTVHPKCALAGYDGFKLTPIFAELMQNIMRKRGVTVSATSEITDWREFWIKANTERVIQRLSVRVYGDGFMHISGNFAHKDGPDIRFYRTGHGAAAVLPYIKMEIAPSYDNPDAFVRDLERKLTPQINERIGRLLRDLDAKLASFSSTEVKNAQ